MRDAPEIYPSVMVAWQSSALFPTTVRTVSGATGMNLSPSRKRKGTPTSVI